MARKFIVCTPIADLRSEPKQMLHADFSHQELRESQLLYGERLELLEEKNEWLRVVALEQPLFDAHDGWRPYRGWIHRSEAQEVACFPNHTHVVCSPTTSFNDLTVTYGTFLSNYIPDARPIPKHLDREALVQEALSFVGAPYLWGGRAYPLAGTIASVDCSGLVNLLYRAQGIYIPRNAHDQYLYSKPTLNLKPGDPLFLAKHKRISHVIISLDNNRFIEAPETGKTVRLLKWKEDIWEEAGNIWIYDRSYPFTPYPGTFVT
jgi:hypothetical protein